MYLELVENINQDGELTIKAIFPTDQRENVVNIIKKVGGSITETNENYITFKIATNNFLNNDIYKELGCDMGEILNIPKGANIQQHVALVNFISMEKTEPTKELHCGPLVFNVATIELKNIAKEALINF